MGQKAAGNNNERAVHAAQMRLIITNSNLPNAASRPDQKAGLQFSLPRLHSTCLASFRPSEKASKFLENYSICSFVRPFPRRFFSEHRRTTVVRRLPLFLCLCQSTADAAKRGHSQLLSRRPTGQFVAQTSLGLTLHSATSLPSRNLPP